MQKEITMNTYIAGLGIALITFLFNASICQEKPELKDEVAPQKVHRSGPRVGAQVVDRAHYKSFITQLNIFKDAQATSKTKKSAAVNMLRFFNSLKTERFKSLAITHLNRNGLTISQLESIIEQKNEA